MQTMFKRLAVLVAFATAASIVVTGPTSALELEAPGVCGPGLTQVGDLALCTHGPDAGDESDYEPDADPEPGVVGCDGDGTSGARVRVFYVHAEDRENRFAEFRDMFVNRTARANRIFSRSASRTGGQRAVRFVTQTNADGTCTPTVTRVQVSWWDDDNFAAVVNAMNWRGYNSTSRKYLIFVDAPAASGDFSGQGTVEGDDSPGQTNANNTKTGYAIIYRKGWDSPKTIAHELMHNFGGVQNSAPHSSGGYHCTDENDRMCYSDSPWYPSMQTVCSHRTRNEGLFDCRHDDYFHTDPNPSSYVGSHWNTANSKFLVKPTTHNGRWAYAYAHQPTATTAYTAWSQGHWRNQNVTVLRTALGRYNVNIPGAATSGGAIQVTAVAGSDSCKLRQRSASGSTLVAGVSCFDTAGAAKDVRFRIVWSVPGTYRSAATLVADQPSAASYEPSVARNTNGSVKVARLETGRYDVRLYMNEAYIYDHAGVDVFAQTTAVGTDAVRCSPRYVNPQVADLAAGQYFTRVLVDCFKPVVTTKGVTGWTFGDSAFEFTAARGTSIMGARQHRAGQAVYEAAPATGAVTTAFVQRYDEDAKPWDSDSSERPAIVRIGTGNYTVTMPHAIVSGTSVQAVAIGSGRYCTASTGSASSSDGVDLLDVNVRCYSATGGAADSGFAVSLDRANYT